MKIVFVGGKYYYGRRDAGYNYEYQHIAGSLNDDGHEIHFIDYFVAPHISGFPEAITNMVEYALIEYSPDLLIYNPYQMEMDWQRFGAFKVPKILLLSDDEWRRDYGLALAPYADFILSNAHDAAQAYGNKALPWQWGCRASLYTASASPIRPQQVVFFGQNYGRRAEAVMRLRRAGISVYTRGLNWEEGECRTDTIPAVYQCAKIGLNMNLSSDGRALQIKARNFEIPASGALLLAEYAPGLERYFTENEEAVYWRTLDELVDKAQHLLSDPQACYAIGQQGRQRAITEHTYSHRFAAAFAAMGLGAVV